MVDPLETREEKLTRIATRLVGNMQLMQSPDDRIAFMGRILNMLDDTHIVAIDFGIAMTPRQYITRAECPMCQGRVYNETSDIIRCERCNASWKGQINGTM